MAYDTMLRPDDPLDRRFNVTYGSPPSGVTREQAASEDAAKRFARRRVLMGIQGGLGAGIEAGGGFFGNLLRGASGSLGGTLQANQMQHEEERQSIADQGLAQERQRQYQRDIGRDAMDFDRIINDRLQLRETQRHNIATETGTGGYKSELEFYLKDPTGYQKYKEAGRAAGEDYAPMLTPEAKTMAAKVYAQTGTMVPMGMGKAGAAVRADVLNTAAREFKNTNPAQNKADYQASSRALTTLTNLDEQAAAFEQMAHNNANILRETLSKVPNSGTRFGNKLARAFAKQMGDPDVAAFDTAREVVKNEYARLVSSLGAGSSMLPEGARKDIDAVIKGDFTPKQIIRALEVLARDAASKRKSLGDRITATRKRLEFNPAANQPDLIYNPATGELEPAQ